MNRLYTSATLPGEGAVYRDLVGPVVGECLGSPLVVPITPPGCSIGFTNTDNEYARLPTSFPPDVEIDTEDYDNRFLTVHTPAPDPDYPDLWGRLSAGLQEDVLLDACYCPGEGIDKPGLNVGKPTFPVVAPLPFFWFPPINIPRLTIREVNPDSSMPGTCCPDDSFPHIHGEIVGNEIRLTHYEPGDAEERYRTEDIHETFQATAGFPRWCCMTNECAEDDPSQPAFVKKWLHFPRWPSTFRNPYSPPNEEPLGLIPFLIDIQCDPVTGLLHVYHGNLIVHDGIIADLQWDVPEPREVPGEGDPTVAPTHPSSLPINKDYQGSDIYDPDVFIPSGEPLLGSHCVENCTQAIGNMLRPLEACAPECPQDGVMCTGDGVTGYEADGSGATSATAIDDALNALEALVPPECLPLQIIYICFTEFDVDSGLYLARLKTCCGL